MAFDAEAAWADLAEAVQDREGWGTDRLLALMKKMETRHRVSEDLLRRTLRLYGGQLTLVPVEGHPAGEPGAVPSAAEEAATSPTVPEEEHDERAGHYAGVAG